MRCKTLESMTFVDLALTDDSAVAISSSVVLNFSFPERINGSDKNNKNADTSIDEISVEGKEKTKTVSI